MKNEYATQEIILIITARPVKKTQTKPKYQK